MFCLIIGVFAVLAIVILFWRYRNRRNMRQDRDRDVTPPPPPVRCLVFEDAPSPIYQPPEEPYDASPNENEMNWYNWRRLENTISPYKYLKKNN